MLRREFMTVLGAAAAWPFAAPAQQAGKIFRVGYLASQTTTDNVQQRRFAALIQALEKLGWTDGRNMQIDYRGAGADVDRARAFAKELVALIPDVILATGTVALLAVQSETRTIPIVFAAITDPIGQGVVTSLAHPGGNITGFAYSDPTMGSKWLELLKEIAPNVARVALLFNPETSPFNLTVLRSIEAVAPSFAVTVTAVHVHDAPEIDRAIAALAREPNNGLIVAPDPSNLFHRELITALAARHRLPAVYALPDFAATGGLLCYGVDLVEQYRQAAGYIDRILKGAKPADLPVQAPTKFELTVNLKTAKALGLTVPRDLLLRADEVIE